MAEEKTDKYNRTPRQIRRLYGEKAKELFGTDLPTPLQIQEYTKRWTKKALNANLFVLAKRIKQLKICLWLRQQGLSKLEYIVRYGAFRSEPDIIIIKDPNLCILAKLKFNG